MNDEFVFCEYIARSREDVEEYREDGFTGNEGKGELTKSSRYRMREEKENRAGRG